MTAGGEDTALAAGKGRVHLGEVEAVDSSHGDLRGDDSRTVPTKDGRNGNGVTLGDLARRSVAEYGWVRHNATQFFHFQRAVETPAG